MNLGDFHGTTVLGVIKNGDAVLGADGQVTYNAIVLKKGARKVRKLYNDSILVGFAGATADAFTLMQKFEEKLQNYQGNLARSAIELAKEWRTDKYLRRLEAMMIAMNRDKMFLLSGTGDVVEPDDNILAIGSGGPYAYAAAKALYHHTDLSAEEIVNRALEIAADLCIYTNSQIIIEKLSNKTEA